MNENLSDDELLEMIVADFTRLTREGSRPEIATYQQKYPRIAGDIEDVLSSVAMIEGLKSETQASAPSANTCRNRELSQRERIGEYLLMREIGRGGMGVVFEAVHQSLGRRVALKVMLEKEFESEKQVARFRREAQAAAKLHHTNIVSVFGVGESGGYHYYVMEFIDGISLKSALKSLTFEGRAGELPNSTRLDHTLTRVAESHDETHASARAFRDGASSESTPGGFSHGEDLEEFDVEHCQEFLEQSLGSKHSDRYQWVGSIGAQVADALGYSHEMGILHRDVKPANLMLDKKGQVWITDFGLVKFADEEKITRTGAVLGTPQYLAPESLKGCYDQKSETYCLGLSLYELASLSPAFAPGSHAELFHRVIHETPKSLHKIDSLIPQDLATVIEKAISKDPKNRYQSAHELRDDLRAFVEDRPISARRPSLRERAVRWTRKNPWLAALTSLSSVLVLSTAVTATWAWAVTNRAYSDLQGESVKKESALKQAKDNLEMANMQQTLADLNASLAADSEQQARASLRRSEANVKLMVETFDGLFHEYLRGDVGDTEALDFSGFNELAGIEISIDQRDAGYLNKMADFYERFARQNEGNQALLDDAARGWRRVANINLLVGENENAILSYERAVDAYREIQELNPESAEALINLVSTRSEMSNAVRRGVGKNGTTFVEPEMLIRANLNAIENHPRRDEAQVQFALAETLTALASAEVYMLIADNVVDSQRPSGNRRFPQSKRNQARYDKHAKRNVSRAIEIANDLIESDPDDIGYRLLLGKSHCSLGALESNLGEQESALASLEKAVELFDSLSTQDPENPNYQYLSALSRMLLPTDESTSLTEAEIRSVQETADALSLKTPRSEFVQLQIVSRLKLADFYLSREDSQASLDSLTDAIEVLANSTLEGAASRSMRGAVFRTAHGVVDPLPARQRREFMMAAQRKLQRHAGEPLSRRRRGLGRDGGAPADPPRSQN